VTIQPGGCKTAGVQKASPLQISFCISILIHAMALGMYIFAKSDASLPMSQGGENPLALAFIAAPKIMVVTPDQYVEKPITRPRPINPVIKSLPLETRPAIPVSPPRQPVEPPAKPVAQASYDADAHSPALVEDAPTLQPQPGLKAKPDDSNNQEPVYPELAQRRHEQGLVLLAVTVTAQGQVAAVEIKKSSHFPLLDDAALEAVRHWNFEPARIGPIAFQSEIDVPVRFELKE
jgi:periplasmic protein TonB